MRTLFASAPTCLPTGPQALPDDPSECRSPALAAANTGDGLPGKTEPAISLIKDVETWLKPLARDPRDSTTQTLFASLGTLLPAGPQAFQGDPSELRLPARAAGGAGDGLLGKREAASRLIKDGEQWLDELTRDPLRQAIDLLNGFIRGAGGKGSSTQAVSPIRPKDVTLISYAANSLVAGKVLSGGSGTAIGNAEVSFEITGAAYLRLINGMVARSGSPVLPPGAAQVNADNVYTVQYGLTANYNRVNAIETANWQGGFQVFQVVDTITGTVQEGSMGYGWDGSVGSATLTLPLTRSLAKEILKTPITGSDSFFYQPTTAGTTAQVPQQPVALAYVQNVIGQTPSTDWPMASAFTAGLFDPIPTSTAFVPTDFGIS